MTPQPQPTLVSRSVYSATPLVIREVALGGRLRVSRGVVTTVAARVGVLCVSCGCSGYIHSPGTDRLKEANKISAETEASPHCVVKPVGGFHPNARRNDCLRRSISSLFCSRDAGDWRPGPPGSFGKCLLSFDIGCLLIVLRTTHARDLLSSLLTTHTHTYTHHYYVGCLVASIEWL